MLYLDKETGTFKTKSQLLGRLPAGVSGHDDVVRVNHDRHLEAEFFN